MDGCYNSETGKVRFFAKIEWFPLGKNSKTAYNTTM